MVNFYQKYIAEGKAFLIFSIIIGIIVRNLLYYVKGTSSFVSSNPERELWHLFFHSVPKANSDLFWINLLVIAVFGILLAYTSWHYALIREKSFLPFSFAFLLLCSQQQLLFFSDFVLASLFYLAGICHSFRLYQSEKAQWHLFHIACLFALSSLISIQILPYVVLIFFGLIYLRIFNFKNILSVLFGLSFVYWLAFLTCIAFGKFQLFVDYWQQLSNPTLLHILHFTAWEWLFLVLYVLLFMVVLINFHLNLYKDKIRIRWQMNFLLFLSFLFFLSYCLACWDLRILLLLTIGTFVIPLSHYFSLDHSKLKTLFFYVLLVIYLCIGIGQVYSDFLF